MAPAHERFAKWLDSQSWNQGEAARRLGCSQAYVHYLRTGMRRPALRLACVIEKLTSGLEGGPIHPCAWLEEEMRTLGSTGTDD
jgi:hypothetical protein